MRAKILRALAHLKAAKLHVEAARDVLCNNGRGGWVNPPLAVVNAVNGALCSVAGTSKEVEALYAREVVERLEPAELP